MNREFYAPVILFVFNRPEHTCRVLNALNDNHLAEKTTLHVFSDGARNDSDIPLVEAVRKRIETFCDDTKFHSVHIHCADRNLGCRESVIAGVTAVLNQYGRAIVVEDDILCRRNFLNYMNDALDMYEKDERIFSIGAHTKPFPALKNYPYDVFLTYRACSWGWGIWKDRWDMIDWAVSDYESFKRNPIQRIQFAKGGADLFPMLENEMNGLSSAWDLRLQYAMAKSGRFTVYPKVSYAYNVGFDGSGTHCSDTGNETFDDLEAIPYKLVPDISLNRAINHGFLSTEYPGIVERGIRKIKKMIGHDK